jgi:hypothetical protein
MNPQVREGLEAIRDGTSGLTAAVQLQRLAQAIIITDDDQQELLQKARDEITRLRSVNRRLNREQKTQRAHTHT